MYTPTVRGGKKMSVGMLCLGKHWNGLTYKYEETPVRLRRPAPFPRFRRAWPTSRGGRGGGRRLRDAPRHVHHELLRPRDAKLGVHQDKDERPETIAAGIPIVSVSLGDEARFVVGGLSREDPTIPIMLRSGDVLVMGGPSRLRYHGVTRILPGTAPDGTGPGRFNLTFRQW